MKKKSFITSTRKKIFVLVTIIIALVAGWSFFKDSFSNKEHFITLSQSGYNPARLEIRKGDTVTFRSLLNKPFWPASNLHPTHEVYSAFDPKKPVQPGETWSFTFDKEGEWKFHDHLFPLYEGVITVSGKNVKTSTIDTNKCNTLERNKRLTCWEKLVGQVVADQGIEKAFNLIDSLYRTQPDFMANCHNYVHILGKEAYKAYSENEQITLSTKSSYCGYGFYHGFMEALLTSGGSIKQAKKLCEQAAVELSEETSDASGACYHGIGHGLADQHDDRYQGDAQAMTDPALKVCEEVSDNDDQLYRCTTGVYNAIEILTTAGQYGLAIDQENPFSFCEKQQVKYQKGCYPNFVPAVMALTNNDYDQSMAFISKIENDTYAVEAMSALTIDLARLNEPTAAAVEQFVSVCRNSQPRFQMTCISSLGEGLMRYGPPQQEYKEAIRFCSSEILTSEEKNVCMQRLLSILPLWYSAEKTLQICKTVAVEYQSYCRY